MEPGPYVRDVSFIIKKTLEILSRDYPEQLGLLREIEVDTLTGEVLRAAQDRIREKRHFISALDEAIVEAADILEKRFQVPMRENIFAIYLLTAALEYVVADMIVYPDYPLKHTRYPGFLGMTKDKPRYIKTMSISFEELSLAALDVAELLSRKGFDGFQYNEPMNYLRAQLGKVLEYATPIKHPGIGRVDWIALREERIEKA